MQIGVEASRMVENKRIFVVDDDEVTRAALQFMLHDENETHEVSSLDEALAKGSSARPDLILLGLRIVEASGPDVLRQVASVLPGTRIMLVADKGRDEAAWTLLPHGAHGVLSKPLTVETVRRRVDAQLGRLGAPMVQLQAL